MNGAGGGGRIRKFLGPPAPPPSGRRKDKDDQDLLLFREMHKQEKDRIASLLQPVSDEFEANGAGNYPLYRMGSAKKGPLTSSGYELLADTGKNDYDWLKTPPATPLFPSLEMDASANATEFVVHRELPITQPLSRFSAGNSVTTKLGSIGTCKSPISKQNAADLRSVTPSERPKILETKSPKGKPMSNINQKTNQMISNKASHTISRKPNFLASTAFAKTMSSNQQIKESPPENRQSNNFLGSNLSKSMMGSISDSKQTKQPRSRGVSPVVRSSKIPATAAAPQLTPAAGLSSETPPNLRTTDRSSSASRGRPHGNNINNIHQKIESNPNPKTIIRRQSCSPSVTRGRKVESKQENTVADSETTTATIAHKLGRVQLGAGGGNGTQILGSRMVDRFMTARKSSVDLEKSETKAKLNGGSYVNENNSGFGIGRTTIISKSSLDHMAALKHMHMDVKRDAANVHRASTTTGRSHATINSTPSSISKYGAA